MACRSSSTSPIKYPSNNLDSNNQDLKRYLLILGEAGSRKICTPTAPWPSGRLKFELTREQARQEEIAGAAEVFILGCKDFPDFSHGKRQTSEFLL
jgi:hypothetical protein